MYRISVASPVGQTVSVVLSSSVSVHQRQAAMPSVACIASTPRISRISRHAGPVRARYSRSRCRTNRPECSMVDVRRSTSAPSGMSLQPVSSASSRSAAAWKSSPSFSPPPGVVQWLPFGGPSS